MHNKYVKEGTVEMNGKNRVLYKKVSSKSIDPILYIRTKDGYVSYKSYLKNGRKRMKGGIELDKNLIDSIDAIIENASNENVHSILKSPIEIAKQGNVSIHDVAHALQNYIQTKYDFYIVKIKLNSNLAYLSIIDSPDNIYRERQSGYQLKPTIKMELTNGLYNFTVRVLNIEIPSKKSKRSIYELK